MPRAWPSDKGGGYFNIVNTNSNKCIDVTNSGTGDGVTVLQVTCGAGTNQQWTFR